MLPVISFAATQGQIDTQTGVIHGVSLITQGPALGHGVWIDAKTLEQVKASAETYQGGLKVKLDHSGGAGDIVGYIDALRIDGQKLLGDLHLLDNSPHRAYILEIAQKIPDTFGLSISFSGPSEPSLDNKTILQRCSEIYSVDLVSEPAANPDGFFNRKLKEYDVTGPTVVSSVNQPKPKLSMNEQDVKALIESSMMAINDRLSKLETAIAADASADVASDVNEPAAAMKSQNDAIALASKEAALLAIKEFAKQFGAPAVPTVSAEVKAPEKLDAKFENIVASKSTELKGDKSAAIAFAIKNNPKEYSDYRNRVLSGEFIKL